MKDTNKHIHKKVNKEEWKVLEEDADQKYPSKKLLERYQIN